MKLPLNLSKLRNVLEIDLPGYAGMIRSKSLFELPNSRTFETQKLLTEGQEILPSSDGYRDQKDPSPVAIPDKFNKKLIYHLYATRGSDKAQRWDILHALSSNPHGPWTELDPILTGIEGKGVAAPGAIYDKDDGKVHMFLQTEFAALGGAIEHLESEDGFDFKYKNTALKSTPETDQAGIYDPQPILTSKNERYIVYTGMPTVSHGDIFLAKSLSNDWNGPYETRKIISHEQVNIHNQHDHPDYEWGLEGGSIVELPNGNFLFTGVLFLGEGERGTRQRVFGAIADDIDGPYTVLGVMVNPKTKGENGHPGTIVEGDTVRLYYQQRDFNQPWKIAEKDLKVDDIMKLRMMAESTSPTLPKAA